ncbi:glycoside hydrolase family 20 protein [Gelidibacter maritimus]|uniref:beta-N-acetylhexosaminidase n=1 Tax=Gelidibacter maritimus TaxID=2761487 RepID=A0A7W2R3V1_9FLAO|nr:family 20 glycosylhydrolase [Gelidibacter maritimus]MBA6153236.1 family 20 glycosylhydrolase [Gelidibacter maritimus]
MNVLKQLMGMILIILMVSCQDSKQSKVFTEADIAIIPKPVELTLEQGSFQFNDKTQFVISEASQKEVVTVVSDKFQTAAGWTLGVVEQAPNTNFVQFITDENLEDEAYHMNVNSDRVQISASGNAGFLYGLETLRQLLPIHIESSKLVSDIVWEIPNLTINDHPRYRYRGLMLDVSRHFFEIDYLKKTIDRLAFLKMNVLHLHLVDDQGWRIEIKKYPKLTEVGAWRVDQEDKHWDGREETTAGQKGTYGGFYTQEELKDLVAYAATRSVEVIPEIEMPAHVTSAIAAYPELSCHERPVGVPSGGVWPITDIYCAGKENTFEFLENVLLEVMDIFPSKYIHVGGDEATKTNWEKCPDCQKRMKTEGLENVEELQSYFIKRMERFINSKGKRLIGWDEILEGGIAPEATVMSWRGTKGGVEAAEQGHDVIMTPGSHAYFDHYQGPQNEEPLAWGGYTPLSKVYTFDPVVETMNETEANHVLGGQANLWSEQIKTTDHSEYMIFPRLAALSETLWSTKESRDWDDFSHRIETLFKRFDMMGINYAKSSYLVMEDIQIDMDTKEVSVELKNEYTDADIRYTLNDEELNTNATKYTEPIKITETTEIHASVFKDNQPIGKPFNTTIEFHKAVGKPVTFKVKYDDRYQGEGEFGLVNTLRATKNYQDGHWQAWLGKDMEAVIDLGESMAIHEVGVGTLENQGPSIYFPTSVTVSVSDDGKNFKEVGTIERAFAKNPSSDLKTFNIEFEEQSARYVKVVATVLKSVPKGGHAWLFVDEIIIN